MEGHRGLPEDRLPEKCGHRVLGVAARLWVKEASGRHPCQSEDVPRRTRGHPENLAGQTPAATAESLPAPSATDREKGNKMRAYRLFFQPERAVSHFKRLRLEELEVSLRDVLLPFFTGGLRPVGACH